MNHNVYLLQEEKINASKCKMLSKRGTLKLCPPGMKNIRAAKISKSQVIPT